MIFLRKPDLVALAQGFTADEENSKQLKSLVMSCRSTRPYAPAGNAASHICVGDATHVLDGIASRTELILQPVAGLEEPGNDRHAEGEKAKRDGHT
jgi:hypothetical protein